MERTLYYTQRSPYARKVRILLIEKGLDCDLRETDIVHKSAELLSLSPIGKVPVFIDQDGTTLWDSTLIMEYLDETYSDPPFYPSDRRDRLYCRQWEEVADHLADSAVSLWLNKRKGGTDANDQTRYQTAITRLLFALDQKLMDSDYLLGSDWTAADVAALCALGYYSVRLGTDWEQQYPQLAQWFESLHQRDSVHSTIPVV